MKTKIVGLLFIMYCFFMFNIASAAKVSSGAVEKCKNATDMIKCYQEYNRREKPKDGGGKSMKVAEKLESESSSSKILGL